MSPLPDRTRGTRPAAPLRCRPLTPPKATSFEEDLAGARQTVRSLALARRLPAGRGSRRRRSRRPRFCAAPTAATSASTTAPPGVMDALDGGTPRGAARSADGCLSRHPGGRGDGRPRGDPPAGDGGGGPSSGRNPAPSRESGAVGHPRARARRHLSARAASAQDQELAGGKIRHKGADVPGGGGLVDGESVARRLTSSRTGRESSSCSQIQAAVAFSRNEVPVSVRSRIVSPGSAPAIGDGGAARRPSCLRWSAGTRLA